MTSKKLKLFNSREKTEKFFITILAILVTIIFLFPLYWLIITSLKEDKEIFSGLTFYPHTFTIEPYLEQFAMKDFTTSLRNSFLIALLSMTISFVLGVPAAYGMGRFNMKGKSLYLLVFLIVQMMPASMLLTPLFLIYSNSGLLNTYLAPALSIASGSVPFIVVTLRPYFKNLPNSLADAAKIDGCNEFTSFLFVMIPVIKSGIVTILTISFLHGWSDLVYSMTFNVKEEMRPLTANIYRFMSKYGMQWNKIMAYGVILVIPVVILFLIFQRHIISGLTSGAVKE